MNTLVIFAKDPGPEFSGSERVVQESDVGILHSAARWGELSLGHYPQVRTIRAAL